MSIYKIRLYFKSYSMMLVYCLTVGTYDFHIEIIVSSYLSIFIIIIKVKDILLVEKPVENLT